MNTVTLTGNLADELTLRYTANGTPVVNDAIAVNRRVRVDGDWQDRLDGFFDFSVFGSTAEHAADSLGKGDRVTVAGRLEQRSYEDTEGVQRRAVQVVADTLAADLRFASAEVTKASKAEGNGQAEPAADTEDAPF